MIFRDVGSARVDARHISAYWFGTQSTIDADWLAEAEDPFVFHHGTDVLQV